MNCAPYLHIQNMTLIFCADLTLLLTASGIETIVFFLFCIKLDELVEFDEFN